jgi:predicted signal transduction protein with EAL and GGDEF domain
VSDESLIRAMPDLVMFIRPDGLVMDHFGGKTLPFLFGCGDLAGCRVQDFIETSASALILRLIRRAIADRDTCEAEFKMDDASYLVRIHPQGPQRVMCVMRHVAHERSMAPDSSTAGAHADGFLGQLLDTAAQASLREQTFALCVIFLDGLAEVGELIDFSIRQHILDAVIQRSRDTTGTGVDSPPILGVINETLVGAIVTAASREHIRRSVESMAAHMSKPVHVNDASFVLSPHIGVAIFGQDASTAQSLLDNARAAMLEARRSGGGSVHFYSDTVRMLPVLRMDIERELREAIRDGQIRLKYLACHDLRSGRMTGLQSYIRWVHPLRGDISLSEFLPIAESTDLAATVSRAALERLARDLPRLRRRFAKDVPVYFGPLRHHLSTGRFLTDFLGSRHAGTFTSGGLILRVAERSLGALSEPSQMLDDLRKAGVSCVIDEMGSGTSSLPQLAQLPIAGLQITRQFVVAAANDPRSTMTCKAIVALAKALEVPAIAPGVDDEPSRATMARIGCAQGLGDLYPPVELDDAPRTKRCNGATT